MSTLYLVATPIGNLEDITLRALRILGEVPVIAAEDTRVARKLLTRHGLGTRLVSYAADDPSRVERLLQYLDSGDVALVTDAGTPTISDPGARIVTAAVAAGHRVVPLPGASAPVVALAASGFSGDSFLFVGFLPRRGAERKALIEELRTEPRAIVLFESPHRLKRTLADLSHALGDRPAALGRELTKFHEEIVRGGLGTLVETFAEREPRGEVTLVIGPAGVAAQAPPIDPRAALEAARARGLKPRSAAAEASRLTGVPVRDLYRLLLASDPSDSIARWPSSS